MKYSFLDLKKRLEASLSITVTDGGGMGPDWYDLKDLVENYINFICKLHALHYDQINAGVASKTQIYREHLQASKLNDRKLAELIEERDELVKKNRCLRRMAELSDDCEDIEKYLLEATDTRDLQHAIDFDEFKILKGTLMGRCSAGSDIIDWDGEWFADGHLDKNISEADAERYHSEFIELIQMKPLRAQAKIRHMNYEIDARRNDAITAVEKFKTNFNETKVEIENLKNEVLRRRLLEKQIQEIRDDNTDLEEGLIQVREPTDIRPGPRKPGSPRDEDQAEEDLPEDD